jgi:hypothetical protein
VAGQSPSLDMVSVKTISLYGVLLCGAFPLFHVFQYCKLENRFQAKRKTLCRVVLVSS